ncbi:MAG: 2-oxoglutarate dehydrogenase E1 component, partial [Myxococcales bacterium]|nr:2-oxoglutarate dehydrogenase E1 component [Myxococcales bacterium]
MADLNFGLNAGLVEELYAQYLDNPQSVDASWRSFFDERAQRPRENGGYGARPAPQNGSSAPADSRSNGTNGTNGTARYSAEAHSAVERAFLDTPRLEDSAGFSVVPPSNPGLTFGPGGSEAQLAQASVQARVYQLLNAYRVRGHLYADINPLGTPPSEHNELDLATFGLANADPDMMVPSVDMPGPSAQKLRDVVRRLEETYCRTIGVEFSHIENRDARVWLRERMESSHNRLDLSRDQQLRVLTKLTEAEVLEQFIHGAYGAGTKRFSIEGAESMIPLMDLLIDRAGDDGVDEVVVGMAHRGRLNVLVNIMQKSLREVFAAFEDADGEAHLGRGDVKYHLGYSTDRTTSAGKKVHVTLTFNPSHLEFVNPVVEGRVRAKQDRRQGTPGALTTLSRDSMRRVMPLLIHGDAAFIGQGVSTETLNLCNLAGYKTGGTIHLIVNNQVGFTTDPEDSRSTRYASDVTRMLKVPVFHVNGEDPEAVAQVASLAIEYRQKFQQDVVIDMYCYRRYGHNEGDEPRYTQPRMYQKIDKKPTVRKMYVERLAQLGHVTEAIAESIAKVERDKLEVALKEVKEKGCTPSRYSMGGVWAPYRGGADVDTPKVDTGVPRERLIALSEALLATPPGFKVHHKVLPTLKQRHEKLVAGEPFDWGAAEALAYASLLDEGYPVRLSGQDVRRGTFSHRHAVLYDSETGEPYAPHGALCRGRARFDVFNSPLSES